MSLSSLVLFLVVSAADPKGAVPPSVDPAASCKTCHGDVVALRSGKKDVHADLACADCHPGRAFNPHQPPSLGDDVKTAAEVWAPVAKHTAVPYTQCEMCHHDEVAAFSASIHGQKPGDALNAKKPVCINCHGNIHNVVKGESKREVMERCTSCHAFAAEGKVPTSPFVVDTYRETVHGKMVHLGNDRAAACADCHTGHNVFAKTDARSTVNADNKVKTCQKCHKDADKSFATAISHEPPRPSGNWMAWFVSLMFGILTAGTIVGLFAHVALDFFRLSRGIVATKPPEHAKDGPVAADDQVERFDIHARIQHWGMMASFTTLVFTGWPLKMAHVEASSAFVRLFGGQAGAALIHRGAGIVLLAVAVYHLAYIITRARNGQLSLAIVPTPRDALDLMGNIAYFLGLKSERPRFGRWTYYEKFDYWAVFWGMAIMGGSGLMLWFPTGAARFIPGSIITLAHLAHSDEALLAALAIFLWHFYNVHLKPTIFPMSWVWLTGKLTAEALYEEHREEYERQFGTKAPKAPSMHPTWHTKHIWSVVGLAIIILAGVGVIVGNVRSVREQIAALSGGHEAALPGHEASVAAAAPGIVTLVSVYDKSFDATQRCFECHNKERFEAGGRGFPHKKHFEENGVDKDCKNCHQMEWHKSMKVKTDLCLDCHKASEIGIEAKK